MLIKSEKLKFILLALFCNVLWGSASTFIKLGYSCFRIGSGDVAGQILFAGIRFFFAGFFAAVISSAVSRKLIVPKRENLGCVIRLGMVQTVLQYVFFYIGLAHAYGSMGAIMSPTSTFFAILIASLIMHQEKLTARKIVGCIIGFSGVVLVALNGSGITTGFKMAGEGALLLAAFFYGCSSVLIKKYSERENPLALTSYQFMFGGALMIIFSLLFGARLTAFSTEGVLVLFYLSLVSCLAFSIWSMLLKNNPVSKVVVWSFTNPIFGVCFSALLLGEGKNINWPRVILALALVCFGVYLVNTISDRKEKVL